MRKRRRVEGGVWWRVRREGGVGFVGSEKGVEGELGSRGEFQFWK